MIFYETYNLTPESPYSIYTTDNLNWGIHFHQAFECIYVFSGAIQCTVAQKKYFLPEKQAIFIMPNQPHSITTPSNSHILIIRFQPEMVAHFYKQYNNQHPTSNLFTAHNIDFKILLHTDNYYIIKGMLYTLCGVFAEQTTFQASTLRENTLISTILNYVEKHFMQECSLKTVSMQLGYDYNHISKTFIQQTGLSYINYLNQRRISHACYLIQSSQLSLIDISTACGFGSLRSFNRNFYQICNCTPTEYRLHYHE